MIINITYKTTIKQLQKKVTVAYPFLKVEFCIKLNEKGERITKQQFCDPDLKLLDVAKKPEPGWIVMHPWHTIRYLKEAFKNRFGIHAQFFRKENDQWVQILGTDAFTLDEQNEIGRKMIDKAHQVFRRERELLL
jgi:hypothetical protein